MSRMKTKAGTMFPLLPLLHLLHLLRLLPLLLLVPPATAIDVTSSNRNLACNLLVAVDMDTVFADNPMSEESIQAAIIEYISSLNEIYETSILQNPPNQNMYFRLQEVWLLTNFVPGCRNESVVLSQFSKMDTSAFCLAHLLTFRDFGCVIGLATVGGLCRKSGNTGFTKTTLRTDNKDKTVLTMAHEVGHNFGADHDGANSTAYLPCDPKVGDFIMGGSGSSKKFSSCSIQAMQHRIHQIMGDQKLFKECFKTIDKGTAASIAIKNIDIPGPPVPCPYTPPADDACQDNNPDPPEPPTPPPDPVCGNGVLEHPEECDCGESHEVCTDPCCYPGTLSEDDLYYNSSAVPCRLYTHHPCAQPFRSAVYVFIYSWVFLLVLAVIVGGVLLIDWKYRRCLYGHIVEAEEDIRINIDANKSV